MFWGMFTRCTPIAITRGAKLGNIILEGRSLTICLTHSLNLSFTSYGSHGQY